MPRTITRDRRANALIASKKRREVSRRKQRKDTAWIALLGIALLGSFGGFMLLLALL